MRHKPETANYNNNKVAGNLLAQPGCEHVALSVTLQQYALLQHCL